MRLNSKKKTLGNYINAQKTLICANHVIRQQNSNFYHKGKIEIIAEIENTVSKRRFKTGETLF